MSLNRLSRLTACAVLFLALLLPFAPAARADSISFGADGRNLRWSIQNGYLTISGSGDMEDFRLSASSSFPSWEDSVTHIIINKGVTSIGENAFQNCKKLTDVSIPDTVTEIRGNPFHGCKALRHFQVSADQPSLATIDDVLFSKTDRRLIAYPGSLSASSYEIPQGIRIIGACAFYDCGNLNRVTIPDSVESILDLAFSGCTNLSELAIPDSVVELGANPFARCNSIKQILLSPNHPSLTMQGSALVSTPDNRLVSCFPGIGGLSACVIPEGLDIVGDSALSHLGLTSLTVPGGVTTLGRYALGGCGKLRSVSLPDSLVYIDDYGLAYCSALEEVSLPDSISECGVFALTGCQKLHRVKLPARLERISLGMFFSCKSLSEIQFPDELSVIEDYAFDDCDALEDLVLPEPLSHIGIYAFADCSALNSVTLPEGISIIGSFAFSGCLKLKSINLPDSLTLIGPYAFNICRDLTISVNRDSYAAQYCRDNGLTYVYPDSLDWLNG